MHHKQFMKKSMAVLAASALTISAPCVAFAAEGYQETEKEALSSLSDVLSESWEKSMAEYEVSKQGVTADMTLSLEDAGRSMLGFAVPVDISWLNSLGFNMKVTLDEATEAVDAGLYLNDTYLCSMRVFMDFLSRTEYIQIPELTESYLKAVLTMTDENGEEVSDEFLETFMNVFSDVTSIIPEGNTFGEILERYGTILIDHMAEGEAGEETLTVDGVSQDCKTYEGILYEENASEMAEEILTTAKEDEQLKELLESWSEALPDSEDLYEQFVASIENGLDSLSAPKDISEAETAPAESEEAEDSYISSKIWVDEDGAIAGRQFAIYNDTEANPVITWQKAKSDGASAMLLEVQSDGTTTTFEGSGTVAEGKLNGEYYVSVDDKPLAMVQVVDYDTEGAKEGNVNGEYILSILAEDTEDATMNMLANFNLVLRVASDIETSSSEVELSVLSAGVPIGSLKISGSNGEGAELLDVNSLEKVYDAENEADVQAYTEEMNWDSILDNARQAGVPEDLVSLLDSAIYAAVNGEDTTGDAAGISGDTATDISSDISVDSLTLQP